MKRPIATALSFVNPNRILTLTMAALLAVVAPPLSHCQSADVPADTQQTIHGVVVNSVTNKPIARALVSSADRVYAMFTDQEGRFEFKLPASQQPLLNMALSLAARKPGFLDFRSSYQPGLSMSATNEKIMLVLTPEAIVAGRVSLSTTDLPAGVNVQLFRKEIQDGRSRWFTSGAYSTNSKGEFRIAELGAGEYKLMTREWVDRDPVNSGPNQQHYGYPPVYYPDAPNYPSAGILHVAAGATVQGDFSLTRQPYYPVKIAVANPARGAGLNVSVSLAGGGPGSAKGEGPSGFDLGYNPREQRVEGELPNGTYLVEASNNLPESSSGSVTVTVAGGPVTGPRLTLVRNQSISVVVREELTRPLGDTGIAYGGGSANRPQIAHQRLVNVRLEPVGDAQGGGATLRQPTSPEDDSLVIENVAPGRYMVVADPYGSPLYVASIASGAADLRREPLIVGGNSLSAPIEITVRNDFATVEGTVQDVATRDGGPKLAFEPVAFVYLIPTSDGAGRFQTVGASTDGKFSMPYLEPGTYRLLAFDRPQQLEYQNPEAMRAYEGLGTVVTAVGGQQQQVQVSEISAGKQ